MLPRCSWKCQLSIVLLEVRGLYNEGEAPPGVSAGPESVDWLASRGFAVRRWLRG